MIIDARSQRLPNMMATSKRLMPSPRAGPTAFFSREPGIPSRASVPDDSDAARTKAAMRKGKYGSTKCEADLGSAQPGLRPRSLLGRPLHQH